MISDNEEELGVMKEEGVTIKTDPKNNAAIQNGSTIWHLETQDGEGDVIVTRVISKTEQAGHPLDY